MYFNSYNGVSMVLPGMSPSSGASKLTLAVYEMVVEVAMIAVVGGCAIGGLFDVCDHFNRQEPCCWRKKEGKIGGELEALIWRAAAGAAKRLA